MRIFRRKRGRHALGAAVTSIPSGPLAPPAREAPFAVPADRVERPATPHTLPLPPPSRASVSVPVPAQAPAPGARVQLGFRDGTSTALDPASAQSLALEQLATSLARRE